MKNLFLNNNFVKIFHYLYIIYKKIIDVSYHCFLFCLQVLKDLYTIVTTANDENGQPLCTPFMTLPPKRKLSDYYDKITEPIDLSTIDQCIGTGHYKTADHFDQDMIRLFDNNVRYFGRTSEVGIAAARLRKLYLGSKPDFVDAITEATGSPPSQNFLPPRGSTAGEEDVIRCICGLHR